MSIAQSMLPEFDNEMATTRRVLERVPDDHFGWRPHEKSMSLGDLAAHCAHLLTWSKRSMEQDSYDVAPVDGEPPRAEPAADTAQILQWFDANVKEARAAIEAADDERMMSNWTLLAGGKELFTLPKVAVLRSFIMNHGIHHRGQLTVYLRQLDVALPPVYGPTADESVF